MSDGIGQQFRVQRGEMRKDPNVSHLMSQRPQQLVIVESQEEIDFHRQPETLLACILRFDKKNQRVILDEGDIDLISNGQLATQVVHNLPCDPHPEIQDIRRILRHRNSDQENEDQAQSRLKQSRAWFDGRAQPPAYSVQLSLLRHNDIVCLAPEAAHPLLRFRV